MPTQKTKKAASKRFTVSANGKVKFRTTKQAHFNAKASGDETRRKHSDRSLHPTDENRVQDLLPYAW